MQIHCRCGSTFTKQPYKSARTIEVVHCVRCSPKHGSASVIITQNVTRRVVFSETVHRPAKVKRAI